MNEKTVFETLISCLKKDVRAVAENMNLESSAVVVNQCDKDDYTEYLHEEGLIRCYSNKERGVGLSRNLAMDKADSEIILFSDDDIIYNTGYSEKITTCFKKNKKADLILFNVRQSEGRKTYHIEKYGRVWWHNYGRYPAYSIAARLDVLKKNNIRFSPLFGGGARYSNGEDSLFLHDCLKKNLKIYCTPIEIGIEKEGDSTWFKGYTDKFFFDRGVLYLYLYGRLATIFAFRFLYKNKREFCAEKKFGYCFELLKKGIRYAAVPGTDYPYANAGAADKTE